MELEEEVESGEEGLPAWMATFSDLATLLLTFFVLMLSFANMDVQNFKTAMGSVREAMGVQFKVHGDFEGLATHILELSPVQSGPHISIDETAELVAEQIKKYVRARGLQDDVEVEASPRGIILRARNSVLFDTGSDAIVSEGAPVLRLIAGLFGRFSGELSIQGHTDSRPIHSARFPSNWELSTARATAVMRYLTGAHGLDPLRIEVAGYADTHPVDARESEDARRRNRRVEFLFQFPVANGRIQVDKAFRIGHHVSAKGGR